MRSKLVPRIALVVFGILIALLVLEFGARVWLNHIASEKQARRYRLYSEMKPGDLKWSPHPYLNYTPAPNYRKGRLSHNSLGYRGPEITLNKPEGVYRIVVLGGSTVYSVSVPDNEKTFTVQLERLLDGAFDQADVQVINAGAVAYDSWNSLVNLQFRVLDLDPDLVVIHHGTNDVHARLVVPDAYRGDGTGRKKHWEPPVASFATRHSILWRIVARKLGIGDRPHYGLGSFIDAPTYVGAYSPNPDPTLDLMQVLRSNPPVYFRRNLINMVAVARAHGVRVVLSTWAHSPHFEDYAATPHYQQGFREINDVVREVAAEQEVPLFDFAAVMPTDKDYWDEGRHVSEAGAEFKAALFAEFIAGELGASVAPNDE